MIITYCSGKDTVIQQTGWCREVASNCITSQRGIEQHDVKCSWVVGQPVDGPTPTVTPSRAFTATTLISAKIQLQLQALYHMVVDFGVKAISDEKRESITSWIDFWELPCLKRKPDTWAMVPDMSLCGGGQITIPGICASSIPLVSFLLYLPRVWYNLNKMKYVESIRYGRAVEDISEHLLSLIAMYLAEPLFQMPHGREGFWFFLYYLIKCQTTRELRGVLNRNDRVDGFKSWSRRIVDRCEWPDGVDLYTDLRDYGSHALITPKHIMNLA